MSPRFRATSVTSTACVAAALRPEDATLIAAHLVHAPARVVTIEGATHFVHLDKPERGRAQLLTEVLAFLRQRTRASR